MSVSLNRFGAALGAVALTCTVASTASADALDGQDKDVDVNVSIESTVDPGALTLSVAGTSVDLQEQAADSSGNRVFEGLLPTVTVTDTRSEVPANSYWYVVGNASDFTSETDTISASQLGWVPSLTSAYDGEVAAEENPATSSLDGGQGLASSDELLYIASDAEAAKELRSSWSANANLVLKTQADQAAGEYTSVLTLSLWEDTF